MVYIQFHNARFLFVTWLFKLGEALVKLMSLVYLWKLFCCLFADSVEQLLSVQEWRFLRETKNYLLIYKSLLVYQSTPTSVWAFWAITRLWRVYENMKSKIPMTTVTKSEKASELSSIPKSFISMNMKRLIENLNKFSAFMIDDIEFHPITRYAVWSTVCLRRLRFDSSWSGFFFVLRYAAVMMMTSPFTACKKKTKEMVEQVSRLRGQFTSLYQFNLQTSSTSTKTFRVKNRICIWRVLCVKDCPPECA